MRASDQPGLVWLIGPMGVGKTTVGALLAEQIGRPFLDLDHVIEAKTKRSIGELFAKEGETAFRRIEAACVAEIAASSSDDVIATGGGTPCDESSLRAMRRSGLVLGLHASIDELESNVDAASRPLLANATHPRSVWLGIVAGRASAYGAADCVFERRGRSAEEIVGEIAAWLGSYGPHHLSLPALGDLLEVPVLLGERRYSILLDTKPQAEIRCAELIARQLPPGHTRIGLLTDATVSRLHAPRYASALRRRGYEVIDVTIDDGEAAKSLRCAERVAEELIEGGLNRQSALVALGGGAVGDLGGFVASILARGIACVQIPTTLLAQVDASVGGKTGVNLAAGKNLVGTFHHPHLVYVDLSTLMTLNAREIASGLAEIAKTALLAGGALLASLESDAERGRMGAPELLAGWIASSCRFKAAVVASDEREQSPIGGRLLLNLGHTVGHAIEAHRLKQGPAVRHGEAVALGLVAMARVGEALGHSDPGLERRVVMLLERLGLPVDLDAHLSDDVLQRVGVDKKRFGAASDSNAAIRFVLIERPGVPKIVPLPIEQVQQILCSRTSPRYDSQPRSNP